MSIYFTLCKIYGQKKFSLWLKNLYIQAVSLMALNLLYSFNNNQLKNSKCRSITVTLKCDGVMTKVFPLHILVTDLNHHVRNLLQRELTKAGHVVYTAGNQKEIHDAVYGSSHIDLIILDPELFEIFGEPLFAELNERVKNTTIILHSFSDFLSNIDNQSNIKIVEKNERSIFSLKKIIDELYEK